MAEVFGNQLTSDSSTFIDHRKTTSGMSPATDEVDAAQILKPIIRAAVEHLAEIVSHVKRRPVVNFIGLVPVIGGDDFLESNLLFEVCYANQLQFRDHAFPKS